MDATTLGAAIAIAKTLPDTAAGRAEAAAQRAESAAQTAQEHGYVLRIQNNGLIVTESGVN